VPIAAICALHGSYGSASGPPTAHRGSTLDHAWLQLAASLNSPAFLHMRLLIVGYTDNQGSDAVNDPLSLARAHNVARHIQGKGVDGNRIQVEGRSERQPMVSNEHSYGRTLNRRVEIVLTDSAAASQGGLPR
jgi:flagellar motor protein MotB